MTRARATLRPVKAYPRRPVLRCVALLVPRALQGERDVPSQEQASQFYSKTQAAVHAYSFLTAGGSLMVMKSGWGVLTPFWPVGSCGNMMHT
jgi:hypothetical protein